ncbi:Protein phosphatase methylesterase 1 [Exophiala xenobiotica]|uniref:Protein phosphatase methylesterase 1 n=1 Tax=Vermiconidia calcicola TaxID=1690605 RepID=A0AAV9Q550_9PEZI|nr:Protein phosphatase methylesterase 1 [Exophiala xenobiotica]KAK5535067.1 Protein phosphatase methylesterase 1 [Vermiconidia calcicola]KAK5536247.1 Protein phosphatase methylesterase 1 [Chaetothyriales sp. CCFEE 6169]KAK5223942.1 Protein phosphatase methylesterase 1 [Exophiala xenobiotica]KAK5236631.1 Protein phosphatase methylesterase 1 [Exophiala xenobiotica]
MSDLQRAFARAHLSRLPPEPPPPPPPPILDERDEDQDEVSAIPPESPNDSSSSASSTSSTGTIVPSPSRKLFERPRGSAKSRSSPLPWDDFFSQSLSFEQRTPSEVISHHAYLTPPTSTGPLIVTHHGAGSSGLSFAAFTNELLKLLPGAGVLSLDARGHGQTTTTTTSGGSAPTQDLSLSTLAEDLAFVVNAVKTQLKWSALPDIVLIGHSLGGAVVTEVAHERLLGNALLAYGVLDVVEGSAMDALSSMDTYLSTRPKSFPSLASGIEWHLKSRTIRNTTSARVSVPSLLVESKSKDLWTWRTDLGATKPFWEDWFVGLSKKFLESRGGKLLLLAGTDRLDKELMIGQMQGWYTLNTAQAHYVVSILTLTLVLTGKYQLQVFPDSGHFIQEDQPAKTAHVVADFYRRNDRSALVLPPKVDDLIKQGKLKPPAQK